MSKQDIRRGRKSVQQLFTMCRPSVQSQQSPGALPWSSSSLPAACHLALSYFWDIVPSLEKQTLSPLSSPIKKKKRKRKPPKTKQYKTVFCNPNGVFRMIIQMWDRMQNVWGGGVSFARCQGGNFHCTPSAVHLWPRKPSPSHRD